MHRTIGLTGYIGPTNPSPGLLALDSQYPVILSLSIVMAQTGNLYWTRQTVLATRPTLGVITVGLKHKFCTVPTEMASLSPPKSVNANFNDHIYIIRTHWQTQVVCKSCQQSVIEYFITDKNYSTSKWQRMLRSYMSNVSNKIRQHRVHDKNIKTNI